jgi:hypothetical protein
VLLTAGATAFSPVPTQPALQTGASFIKRETGEC